MLKILPWLILTGVTLRAEQCLVIGDSLTKEYEVTFPALYPDNPQAWQARNWIETLHQQRTDWFDTGTWGSYSDPRIVGHKYNWAFAGATTSEIRSQLNNFFNILWTNTLKNHLRNDVERVVIFAGGNDADSYYADLYNGNVGPDITDTTLDNLQWIVNYVRAVNANLPIVLVSVPHVGCTPKIQQGYPTDPVKTARVTAAMDLLNANLASFAQSQGIGFAPGVYEFTKAIITQPFRIRGIEFYRVGDADARVRYTFSGDGFHPNTCAHMRIAQAVVDAFNTAYPSMPITPLEDLEVITNVLGLDPDTPFNEWLAAQGGSGGYTADTDRDGVPNVLEFALEGFSATAPDNAGLPRPVMQNGALTLTWLPRPVFTEWGSLRPEFSPDLFQWNDVPAAQVVTNPDGTVTASVNLSGKGFVRLKAIPSDQN